MRAVARPVTLVVGIILAAVTLSGVAQYPLSNWLLTSALVFYCIVLWHRPVIFLLTVPIVLPAWDLGIWTGWTMIGESDLFIAATLAVLLLRSPPAGIDYLFTQPNPQADKVILKLSGASIVACVTLSVFALCWFIASITGLTSPLGAPHSDNALLRPDNALRIGKSLLEVLVLLPFLSQRQRLHHDAVTWLGWGFAGGIAVVTAIVLIERLLFASLLDFSTAYRVAGPFSSMRAGGGHIGAYVALALPFSLSLLQLRPRWFGATLTTLVCLSGAYTLVVTFARTAYVASIIAMIIAVLGWVHAAGPHRTRLVKAAIVPTFLIMAMLSATAVFTAMETRFAASVTDLRLRQENWQAGLAVRDPSIQSTLFGMGLGTYQRTMLMRSAVNKPSDLVLKRDGQGAYASMQVNTPFFLGQKINFPKTGRLHLTLLARSTSNKPVVEVLLCDKVLLYSDNCRGAEFLLRDGDQWTEIHIILETKGLGGTALSGLLRRPVELSLSVPAGHDIDVRDISLTDDAGQSCLANGDFSLRLNHWIFTDDSHIAWRMLNQYLMLFFETGVIGLAAFAALVTVAFAGAVRALRSGFFMGAPVAGAIAGFMISGLFDNVLEAPRLATLFFLVCLCGLIQWQAVPAKTRPSAADRFQSL